MSDAQLEKKRQVDQSRIANARMLEEPLRSIRILKILLVSRLRTLRNQFIHGAATDGPYSRRRENDEEPFKRQVELLEELVDTFLAVMKAERPIKWPCIPDARVGSPAHRRRATSCPLNANQTIGRRSRLSENRPVSR